MEAASGVRRTWEGREEQTVEGFVESGPVEDVTYHTARTEESDVVSR